jgi:hypothetical protein
MALDAPRKTKSSALQAHLQATLSTAVAVPPALYRVQIRLHPHRDALDDIPAVPPPSGQA